MATEPAALPLHRLSAAVGPDLTLRQLALLEAIVAAAPQPATLRGLAAHFGFSKPVITRAMKTMEKHELVTRKTDPGDGRSIDILPTIQGKMMIIALNRILSGAV